MAYHYDPRTALEELDDLALLPSPARMRDMLARTSLPEELVVEMVRSFAKYQATFAGAMALAREFLTKLAEEGSPKT
ncbi:hypothetical protein FJZ36_05470 [Candidatus Poribacteria bacterium]|nr:hypothetical protein [Candidatus Poribacteria bacterium]